MINTTSVDISQLTILQYLPREASLMKACILHRLAIAWFATTRIRVATALLLLLLLLLLWRRLWWWRRWKRSRAWSKRSSIWHGRWSRRQVIPIPLVIVGIHGLSGIVVVAYLRWDPNLCYCAKDARQPMRQLVFVVFTHAYVFERRQFVWADLFRTEKDPYKIQIHWNMVIKLYTHVRTTTPQLKQTPRIRVATTDIAWVIRAR